MWFQATCSWKLQATLFTLVIPDFWMNRFFMSCQITLFGKTFPTFLACVLFYFKVKTVIMSLQVWFSKKEFATFLTFKIFDILMNPFDMSLKVTWILGLIWAHFTLEKVHLLPTHFVLFLATQLCVNSMGSKMQLNWSLQQIMWLLTMHVSQISRVSVGKQFLVLSNEEMSFIFMSFIHNSYSWHLNFLALCEVTRPLNNILSSLY